MSHYGKQKDIGKILNIATDQYTRCKMHSSVWDENEVSFEEYLKSNERWRYRKDWHEYKYEPERDKLISFIEIKNEPRIQIFGGLFHIINLTKDLLVFEEDEYARKLKGMLVAEVSISEQKYSRIDNFENWIKYLKSFEILKIRSKKWNLVNEDIWVGPPIEKISTDFDVDLISVALGYGFIQAIDPKTGGKLLEKITKFRKSLDFETEAIRIGDSCNLEHNQYEIYERRIKVFCGFIEEEILYNNDKFNEIAVPEIISNIYKSILSIYK